MFQGLGGRFMMKFTIAAAIVSVALGVAGDANAGFFSNPTGLVSPVSTLDFTVFGLANDQVVTNQTAPFGVTFSPFVYFNPQGGFIPGGRVGNFTFPTEPAFVNPVTFNFSTAVTSAAFQIAADVTPYTFQALLGGSVVDSGNVTVDGGGTFIGFTADTFDAIKIIQNGAGGGPYWLAGNLQFGQVLPPSTQGVPEPVTVSLFATGLAGAIAMRRRKKKNAA
jgi:hypothetical protein